MSVQLALPTGSYTSDEILTGIRGEFSDVLGGNWEVEAKDPDWELRVELDEAPGSSAFSDWLRRLEDLADVAEDKDLENAQWLVGRLNGEATAQAEGTESPQQKPDTGGGVFESIGDDEPDPDKPTGMLADVRLSSYEIQAVDDGVEVRLRLDTKLPTADIEQLARGLAHALRARYDVSSRPIPAEDSAARSDGSVARVRVEPTKLGVSGPLSTEEFSEQIDKYFERLERFDELGVKLADVLGLTAESSSPTQTASRRARRQRTREEPEAPTEKPDETERRAPRREPAESERRPARESDDAEGSGFVLGVEDRSSNNTSPESGLEAGNYRDPRLLREDATTSLVDVVLRHPGYAEEKMGHNLSILLSIDYPEAMELVESAPRVIAWGVAHERGMNFKRVIEKAGGKVVLVEPDSL